MLTGYVHFDYRAATGDAPDAAQTFTVRRARVLLAGPLTGHIRWAVSAEATDTPVLRDAHVSLSYLPGATVRIGQFIMPYSLERFVASSNTMAFTERVLLDFAPGRDAGVMVSNDRPFYGWLTYGVGIANGTGQNRRDDNRAKDAMARLVIAPRRASGLRIGANAARGQQPDGMRTRTGADINFDRRLFQLAAEYLRETTGDGRVSRDGFYALGGWRFYPRAPRRMFDHAEVFARYSRVTGDRPSSPVWDLAANYYVHRRLRLMCDVIVPRDTVPASHGTTIHARLNLRF